MPRSELAQVDDLQNLVNVQDVRAVRDSWNRSQASPVGDRLEEIKISLEIPIAIRGSFWFFVKVGDEGRKRGKIIHHSGNFVVSRWTPERRIPLNSELIQAALERNNLIEIKNAICLMICEQLLYPALATL